MTAPLEPTNFPPLFSLTRILLYSPNPNSKLRWCCSFARARFLLKVPNTAAWRSQRSEFRMKSFFGNVQRILPQRVRQIKSTTVCIDEWAFRLHYRTTTIALLICVGLVTLSEYFGSKIHCLAVELGEGMELDSKFLQTYCLIRPTYTVSLADPHYIYIYSRDIL